MSQSFFLSLIRQQLPELEIQSVEEAGGQFNDILIVNHAWVFRFPRYQDGVACLAAERDLLGAIQPRLPIPVPKIEVVSLDPPVPGLAFYGYRLLPGQPLDRHDLASHPDAIQAAVAAQISNFLCALHAFPPVDLPARLPGGPPDGKVADQRPFWEHFYADVRRILFSAMRPDARKHIIEHFEAYLDDSALQRFYPCLRHGDFGGSNILWDASSGRCSGVIDFSGAALGDPAIDLASVSTLGEAFLLRLLSHYQPDSTRQKALLARAHFYRGTFALMEALDGYHCNDQDAYRSGMSAYV